MIRKIVEIDRSRCNGCGLCVEACHEGAIALVDGKATLIRDDYCDGLGDCLPACPVDAIRIVEREAASYDKAAVHEHGHGHSCPGSTPRSFGRSTCSCPSADEEESALLQWPVQIKLAPVKAPVFNGCGLLIAADCTAYAYASFHKRFMSGKATLIGCPKLDGVDYSGKLAAILEANGITGITVIRMEVPCCGGLEMAVRKALSESGKDLPLEVVTISTDGEVLQ